MSNNKQSSVEILYNKMFENKGLLTVEEYEEIKALHKKEILESYRWGRYDSDKLVMSERFYREQYYNETFNTKEK